MMRARILAASSLGLGVGALVWGYALDGRWAWCLAALAVAGVWSMGYWRRWPWAADAGLLCLAGLAVIGILLGLSTEVMLLALVGALCAWDLDHFLRHLVHPGPPREDRALERRHLGRLLAAGGLGLVLALLALRVELDLSLLSALLLGLLAVLGLGRVARHLRAQSR